VALLTVNGVVRVGTDPELRFSPGGTAVASFRAVASRSKKNDRDEWETTHEMWFGVTAFGHLAEFVAEHVEKGAQVNLLGEIYEEEYETQQGEKRRTIKVLCHGLDPLPKRDGAGGSNRPAQVREQAPAQESPWGPPPGQDDQPPFS
jgi:single-strand DNA-binding protein